MTDIRKIKERLANLLKKAQDNASSDAEIAACMKKAQALMEQYGVKESDLDNATSDSFRVAGFGMPAGRTNFDVIDRKLGNTMAAFCDCKVYVAGATQEITYVGFEADLELLLWLRASFRSFMDSRWELFKQYEMKRSSRRDLKMEKIGFINGFCDMLQQRLTEQKKSYSQATGTALVVRKNDAVVEHIKERFDFDLNNAGRANLKGGATGYRTGEQAGRVAGQQADIGRGVGQARVAIGRN